MGVLHHLAPGRDAVGVRIGRHDGACVGCGDWEGDCEAGGPHKRREIGELAPGQDAVGNWVRGQDGASVGRGNGEGDCEAGGAHCLGNVCQLQSRRRNTHRLGFIRQDGACVGYGDGNGSVKDNRSYGGSSVYKLASRWDAVSVRIC